MLHDFINFIRKLTVRKCLNYLKLKIQYQKYIRNQFKNLTALPDTLSVEPTNRCNLHCHECPAGTDLFIHKKGDLDLSLYKRLLDETHSFLMNLILYFQGEPFLHPNLFEMIKLSREKRIYTTVSTNGHFFNHKNSLNIIKSGLNRLIICVDGLTQSTYSIYRKGGDLDKVTEGIKRLVNFKKEMKSGYS